VGNQVIVTCSGGDKQDILYVVSVDASTGSELWRQQFAATGNCNCHPLSANAAPTPVSDGTHIYAFFSSNDLACLDLEGNLIWYRGLAYDFPKIRNDTGMGSSPVIVGNTVIVQCECQGTSFAAGLDAATGVTRWTIDRPQEGSWSSPLVLPGGGRRPDYVLLQSKGKVSVIEPVEGKEVAMVEGQSALIPSASLVGERVYVPLDGTTAYDVDANGQLSKVWASPRLRASTASLVVADNQILSIDRTGVLAGFDLETGERKWQERILDTEAAQGGFWATPLLVGNHYYFFGQSGQSRVVEVSDAGAKVVHSFDFGETVLGSPAVSGNAMYVRGDQHLWKIAEN
jgi:outer membrane protein assembly factor BamB